MKKKRVAIVTIESNNFGNRLQNYALQEMLRSLACEVVTLRRNKKRNDLKAVIKACCNTLLRTKASKFNSFNLLIQFSDEILGKDTYPEGLENLYDFFVCGSDQVWNPYYNFVGGICDFLAFAPVNKRIAYAPSFGVDEIPNDKKEGYAENLKLFKSLSVREKRGAEIIKELTGRDAQVVLDPTMILTGEQWSKVEKRSIYTPKNKYALVYSLGEKSSAFENAVNRYGNELEIIDIRSVQKNGREIPVGPAEFLYLIHHAELILTDSFHASVFSVLFHKRFITFKRPGINMSSRIVSLANIIGQVDKMDEENNLDCNDCLNFKIVDQLIEVEREKSINYLKKALED